MWWIALVSMMSATLAQHLGLTEAIAGIIRKVAGCPKCCTFWTCTAILVLCGYNIIVAIPLSLVMAYFSHWFGLVLYKLNIIYNMVWQRLQRKG